MEPVAELKPHEKHALLEFRTRVEAAIAANRLLRTCHHEKSKTRIAHSCSGSDECPADVNAKEDLAEIALWGVPLLPSKGHDGTDVVLLKFLRARGFKVPDALEMLQRTLRWRRQYGVDGILDETTLEAKELEGAAYMDSTDKDGHPICYNNYWVFKDKDLYRKTFGNDEKRKRFLRWRVQSMERDIRQLSFKPGEVGSMVQVTDLKSSSMRELRTTANKITSLFQDNYPEFVAKNIFINVSMRYYAYHALFSQFFTQRTKSKFIFARPSKVTETLLKYIAPENLPVQYGGLKREEDDEFSAEDGVSEMAVRGGCAATIVIPVAEPGVTVVWDLTVVGWEVNYKEEFIPDDEGSYRVLINKEKNLEGSIRNSFYINEPGKMVLTIDNRTFKKKRILYRSKSKLTVPLYDLLKQTKHLVV